MADNVLKARIVLEAPGVAAVTNAATAAVKKLKDSLAGVKGSADIASFSIGKVGTTLRAVRNPAAEAAAALDKTKLGANQAGNALQNLGRIAQDAPFGFIGIQNNINPLLESFQRLKASTGSTGGALKALASQLGGAGGLGLAVSVVTGLLTVFSKEIFGSGSAADASKSALDRYQDAVDELKESVDDASKSISFANQLGGLNVKIFRFGQDIGNELQDLREQSVAQDEAIYNAREYTKKIRAAYEEQNKDLEYNTKESTDLYEKYIKDLADAGDKETEEVNKQRLIFRQIALQKLEDQKEADDKAKAAQEKAKADYEKYVNDTISKAKQLSSYLNEATFRNFDIDFNPLDSLQTQFEQARKFIERATNDRRSFDIKINATPKVDFDVSGAAFRESIAESVLKINEGIQKEIPALTKRNPVLIQMAAVLQGFYDFEEKMRRAAADLAKTVQGAFQNAFVGLAQGIGEAIGGENIGQALFSVIGDLISQIGKALIQYGIIKTGLDKILSAGIAVPGAAAIALGAAALAIGGLIKNTRVRGQRALGGPVNAGSPYLVGERGQEVFVPNTAGRIVANSALAGNIGGRGTMQVQGRLVASGNSLVALIESVNNQQRRLS